MFIHVLVFFEGEIKILNSPMRFFRGIVVLFVMTMLLRWNIVEKYSTTPK
jgi:hypothetical protein